MSSEPCTSRVVSVQLAVCVVGIMFSLIPQFAHTQTFWGIDVMTQVGGEKTVTLRDIQPGSPADRAGFRNDDKVVSMDGAQPSIHLLREQLDQVPVGVTREVVVQRDGKSVTLRATGMEPPLVALFYWDWQFLALAAFFALFVLLLATQPLQRKRLWRPIVVILVGVGLGVGVAYFPSFWFTRIWQAPAAMGPFFFPSDDSLWRRASMIALVALLVLLAAWEIRCVLSRPVAVWSPAPFQEPTAPGTERSTDIRAQ